MIRYPSPIDTHVHLRWNEAPYTFDGMNFMQLGLRDAAAVGLIAMNAMPNTTPNLITHEIIADMADYVDAENPNPEEIYVGFCGGITNDLEQVRGMAILAELSRINRGRIKALKEYFAHSTGNMGITDPDIQKAVWREISSVRFRGNVSGHFEAEDKYAGEFDHTNPISHSLRQNPESELVQAERQIRNAYDAEFEGTLISAHTSNPNTVDYILAERENVPFQIAIEMTWHHMFLNTNDYAIHGNGVKMNPPLRSPEMQSKNLEHVLRGNITMIGTDHAPHDPAKKLDRNNPSPPSGIPAIAAWPLGIAALRQYGIKEEILENLIFHNANGIFFDGKLRPRKAEVKYKPELWDAYGYNPFSRIEKEIGLK